MPHPPSLLLITVNAAHVNTSYTFCLQAWNADEQDVCVKVLMCMSAFEDAFHGHKSV